jgi:alanine racemase
MSAELRVDLQQFRANVRAVRRRMAPAEVLVVIKDDAYAQGVEPLVGAALEAGATWFGGIDVPSAVRAKRVAGDRGDAAYLERIASVGAPATVHLKIDTGLHRNGVRPEQWRMFCARAAELESAGRIRVAGIWSHIAEASDREDDVARAAFDAAVAEARAAGLTPDTRHLAASAAAWHRPEFRYELVRIGAFCYGIRSADGPDIPGIAPISSLVARVSAVDDLVEIDLGSVDGYPSALAGRARVATPAGPRALLRVDPFSSRVEPWPGVAVGDEVIAFGPGTRGEPTPTDLGELLDTVGEEPLLRVSPLVERVYTD